MAYLDRQRFEQHPICPQICNNSLVKDSPEMGRIQKAVKQVGISVVLGYCERSGGSIYSSSRCLTISPSAIYVCSNLHFGEVLTIRYCSHLSIQRARSCSTAARSSQLV